MNGDDQLAQTGVLLPARTQRSLSPGVEAAAGDLQQLAHPAHLVVGLLSLYEPEHRYRVGRLS